MLNSIIKPKRPTGPGWERFKDVSSLPIAKEGYPFEVWAHPVNRLSVISAVEVATEKPGMPALGPAYHLSISNFGKRCTSGDAVWVLGQFDLVDAKEDNHVPNGMARNFWRYVADNLSGIECPCVAGEPAIVEDKGDYVWRGTAS